MTDPARQLAMWAQACPAIDPSSTEQIELFGKLRREAGPGSRVSMKLFLARLPGIKSKLDCGMSVELMAFGVPRGNFPKGLPAHLQDALLTPFGLPETIVHDQDGSYGAEFEELLNSNGALMVAIPAESHNQLGRIERHKHAWRGHRREGHQPVHHRH